MKYLITIFILIFFTSCARYSNHDLHLNNELKIAKTQQTITSTRCTNESFIANLNDKKYGKLFVEHISLDSNCHWNGFQRGYFEYLYKSTLQLKSFELISRVEYDSYEISTYIINEEYYLNLIYDTGISSDTFIIDYNGILSEKLIRNFEPNYKNKYINKKRFAANYSNSLVRMNLINSYFTREEEPIDK